MYSHLEVDLCVSVTMRLSRAFHKRNNRSPIIDRHVDISRLVNQSQNGCDEHDIRSNDPFKRRRENTDFEKKEKKLKQNAESFSSAREIVNSISCFFVFISGVIMV